MAADLEKHFGQDFMGEKIEGYQTWPSIDGSWLGIEFTRADGSALRIALPQEALAEFQAQIAKAAQLCKERRSTPRH